MTRVLDRTDPERVLRHCEDIGLGPTLVASALAVNPRTVQRWREGSAEPSEASVRALEKLEAIHQLATRLLADDAIGRWFQSSNESLGGERPVDLLSRGDLDRVRNVLGMLQWGIYS